MDVAAIRVLADQLAQACATADGGRIDAAALKRPDFLNALRPFLDALTRDGELTTLVTTYVRQNGAVTDEKIARWAGNPEHFFSFAESDPPTQLYNALQDLSRSDLSLVEEIRRRICLVLFHDLRRAFQTRFHKPKNDPLTSYLITALNPVDQALVKQNCATWSCIGAKYKVLVGASGGNGALLVPTSMSRWRIENQMPTCGNEQTKTEFKKQVGDKARVWRCHEAAEKLFTFYTNKWEAWLQALRWQPPQQTVCSTRKRKAPMPGTGDESMAALDMPAQRPAALYYTQDPRNHSTAPRPTVPNGHILDLTWPAATGDAHINHPRVLFGAHHTPDPPGSQFMAAEWHNLGPSILPFDQLGMVYGADPSELEMWALADCD